MKNILMIVHTFPPLGSVGGSIRIIKFLKYINELRRDLFVTIITLRDDIILLNDLHLSKTSLSELPNSNINIIRTNTLQPRHPNQNQYIIDGNIDKKQEESYLAYIKKLLKKIYNFFEKYILIPDYALLWAPYLIPKAVKESKNIDLIYATAPPFSILIQAVFLKKITKKKLILDIKDDWVLQPKFLNRPTLFRKLEGKLEKFCIKNADQIILVTSDSLNSFKSRYPCFINKFQLITNGCDVSEYKYYWDKQFTHNSKFTIIHSGEMSSRNPYGFLSALFELKNEGFISKDNFEMEFIGPLPSNVSSMILEKKLNDIIISTEPLERGEYIKTIMKADLLLAINYQIKTLIPGKIYDYWGTRRPILLIDSIDSMASKIIYENNLGDVKEYVDTDGIKKSIKYFFNLWKNSSVGYRTNIENLYKYDRKNLTKNLIDIIDSI